MQTADMSINDDGRRRQRSRVPYFDVRYSGSGVASPTGVPTLLVSDARSGGSGRSDASHSIGLRPPLEISGSKARERSLAVA